MLFKIFRWHIRTIDQVSDAGHIPTVTRARDQHVVCHSTSIFASLQFSIAVRTPIATPAVSDDVIGSICGCFVVVISGDDNRVVMHVRVALPGFDNAAAVVEHPLFICPNDGYDGAPVEEIGHNLQLTGAADIDELREFDLENVRTRLKVCYQS